MPTPTSPLDSLREYFDLGETKLGWEVCCKRCNKSWELKRGGEQHPGNILHLLNHAFGHIQ